MSDINFDHPTRQSYAGIILIIYKFYKTLVRQLWPFLLVFLLGGRFTERSGLIVSIGVIASLTAIYGIIAFFKYYFYLDNEELIIEKGVIRKTKTSIPLDRIQSVDFEQNLIHRVFNVVRVKIDTAGSSGKELNLQALSRNKADALRRMLLAGRSPEIESENEELIAPSRLEDKSELILSVDIPELLKVGISANHIKSAWLIFIFFFWLHENLEDAGVSINQFRKYLPDSSIILQSIALILSLIFLFIITSFLFSLIRTVLQYFDLRFIREKNKFKIKAGLFNKKETAALDNKIQIVSWSQNVLQRLLNLFELSLRQASSKEVKLKKNILVPGIKSEQISKVKKYLFQELDKDFGKSIKTEPIYFYRFGFYIAIIFSLVIFLSFYFSFYNIAVFALIIGIYQILSLFLRFKKYSISISEDMILHGSGTFGNRSSLLELHKIQSVSLRQSIYQRRKGLADLLINTAGGFLRTPYLKLSDAQTICDFCLAKVETSQKNWM